MNDGSGWMSVCEVFGALPNQEAVKLSNMTNLREFENLNVLNRNDRKSFVILKITQKIKMQFAKVSTT